MTPDLYIRFDEKPRGVLPEKLVGVWGTLPETPTLFQTWSKIWYPISDLKPWSPARDKLLQYYSTYTVGVNIDFQKPSARQKVDL